MEQDKLLFVKVDNKFSFPSSQDISLYICYDINMMESILKSELKVAKVSPKGFKKEGTISCGQAYETDFGPIFVKCNRSLFARLMFDGEFEGLSAIASTNTVAVPKPIKVLDNPDGGACLVTEHFDIKELDTFSNKLGNLMARLHLHNESLRQEKNSKLVENFGFYKPTLHCKTVQDNSWKNDWVTFFIENRLQPLFSILEREKKYHEVAKLWPKLQDRIPSFFEGIEIKPSLLHGDFWRGNVAETSNGPVIFDLASVFYGHHEYDIAVSTLWGGFTTHFYNAYHEIIPKAPRFNERKQLYFLFQFLHHWVHQNDFGFTVMAILKKLLQKPLY